MKRTFFLIVTLCVILNLNGCDLNMDWEHLYPTEYGLGVVWSCELSEIEFSAEFTTEHIQLHHYGAGIIQYKDKNDKFQIWIQKDRVNFAYSDYGVYEVYFSGIATFSEECMKVKIDTVEDVRYSALRGRELVFYPQKDAETQDDGELLKLLNQNRNRF